MHYIRVMYPTLIRQHDGTPRSQRFQSSDQSRLIKNPLGLRNASFLNKLGHEIAPPYRVASPGLGIGEERLIASRRNLVGEKFSALAARAHPFRSFQGKRTVAIALTATAIGNYYLSHLINSRETRSGFSKNIG